MRRFLPKKRNSKGQITVEFAFMFVLIIFAIIFFERYIVRTISGRFRSTGEQIGDHRVYDPIATKECAIHFTHDGWYDPECFRTTCEEPCFGLTRSDAACQGCISGCNNGCTPSPDENL